MSMDAFAAAIGRGSCLPSSNIKMALKIGATFGVVEATTPLIGYVFGILAQDFVQKYDHWLAFILLCALGLHMIYGATLGASDSVVVPKNSKPWLIWLTAIATSIDEMVIGISLAFLRVNIWLACALIGLTTALMSTLGIILGHNIGYKIGKYAEIFGGVLLFGIGSFILYSHIHAHGT